MTKNNLQEFKDSMIVATDVSDNEYECLQSDEPSFAACSMIGQTLDTLNNMMNILGHRNEFEWFSKTQKLQFLFNQALY